MNTIQEKWESFLNVIPKDAPKVQIRMMKQAFYAGSFSVLDIQMQISQDHISEDAAVQVLEGLHCELADYIDEINKIQTYQVSRHG